LKEEKSPDINYNPNNLTTKPEVLHAESNALMKLARSTNSSIGSTMYLTCSPCFDCAKLIIQSGIIRLVYIDDYRSEKGIELLRQTDIIIEKI
jgi:dCMP deaminase